MAHHSRVAKVIIDVPGDAHDREVAFWQGAVGQELTQVQRFPEYHLGALPGQDFHFLVQRLIDGVARVHLDVHTDDVAAEVSRLEGLGAERVRAVHSWWVMRDPAGLLFCVLPQRPGTLSEANARRWD